MNRLIIVGASGHGKVIADIAAQNGYKDIVFLDDDPLVKECAGYPVLGQSSLIPDLEGDLFIAVGNARIREMLMKKYPGKRFPVLIHPRAVIASDVKIDEGTAVMAGAVINPGVTVGRGCIVNTCSSVDHDCSLGDYVHVSVGTHLSGTVHVGSSTWIGTGAIVINNIDICENAFIGAGAVVVKNIDEPGTYIGIPARKR